MSRKRNYWPSASLKLYSAKRYLDENYDRIITKNALTGTPQETALANIRTALDTNLAQLPEYRESA